MVDSIREVERAMGSTRKEVVAEESETVFVQRRCLYAKRDLKKGQVITAEDLDVLRPALGIPPKFRETIIGTTVNKDIPAKLFSGSEFWTNINKSVASVDGNIDVDAKGTFVQQYTKDGTDYIFNTLGRYWLLWVAGILLLAFVIFSIVVTKTLVEKKKK